jgi:hypothetical protein
MARRSYVRRTKVRVTSHHGLDKSIIMIYETLALRFRISCCLLYVTDGMNDAILWPSCLLLAVGLFERGMLQKSNIVSL